MDGSAAISSGDDNFPLDAEIIPPDESFDWFAGDAPPPNTVRVTPEIISESPKRRLRSVAPQASDRDAKSGIPDIDEWMNFFSRIVVRLAMDWYIDWAFRGIDENILTDRDIDNIKMTSRERDRIARPFAEFCVKNKYTRKHGRTIIATGDSIDAVIQLGMWYNRVNRIASRYRSGPPPQHSHSGSDITRHFERQEARNAAAAETRENRRERTDESAPAQREAGWRPAIGGEVIRTDLG